MVINPAPSKAASARERIRARLATVSQAERSEEFRFTMDNPWSRKIFVALCPFIKPDATDHRRLRAGCSAMEPVWSPCALA